MGYTRCRARNERGRRRVARNWPPLGLFLFVPVVALAAGCLGPIAALYPPRPGGPAMSVWVVDHGWHTGLVVGRASLPTELLPEQRDFPGARYLEFGWGDAEFYRAREPTLGLGLKAAFWSPGSVLHVVGLDASVEARLAGAEVVEVRLSRPGFEALARFIHDTFLRNVNDRPVVLGGGLYPASRFYLARGRYHLLNTCNTWVAEALRAAGCPITPTYAMTAGNVMQQARSLARFVRTP